MGESVVMGVHVSGAELRRATLRREGARVLIHELQREPLTSVPAPGGNGSTRRNGSGPLTVVSLPPADVLTRFWVMPQADEARTRQMVLHRMEAELPVPSDQLAWGFRLSEAMGQGQRGVLLQAARQDRVRQYVRGGLGAGVPVDVLTTESEAIRALYAHGLENQRSGEGSLLVLMAAEQWLVAIVSRDVARTVRRVRIAEDIEIGLREVEQVVRAESEPHQPFRLIWGGSQDLAYVAGALGERLGLPVEPARSGTALDAGVLTGEQFAEYGPAIGLALARLCDNSHLVRFDGRVESIGAEVGGTLQRLLDKPRQCALIAVAMLVVAAGLQLGTMKWESSRMRGLLTGPATSQPSDSEREQKIRALQRVERYRIDVEGILASITARIPDSILISSVQLSRDRRLTLKGTAKDPKAVFTFSDALRKSPWFNSINPERTEPGQSGAFTITAELNGVQRFGGSGQGGGRRWR